MGTRVQIKTDWSWITVEQLYQAVEDEATAVGMAYVLSLPSVYEIVSEALNNDALRRLANENERCTECGQPLTEDGYCSQEGCEDEIGKDDE